MAEAGIRGRFLWYELMTTDTEAAREFYPKVTGWGVQPFEGIGMPYFMWTRGAQPVGGLMDLPEEARKMGAPPHWMAYVGTPDVDATVAQAQGLGAKVFVPPQEIPGVGRFAVLADPQGATFAVYRPAQDAPPAAPPQLGDCSWHELAALDHPKALEFYGALFGWVGIGEAHDMGPIGTYQEFGLPGGAYPLGGMYRKPAEMPAPPHFMLYFRVADVHACAGLVKASGGQVLNGPVEVPGGDFIVNCLDPQGAAFSLHQRKA